MATRVYSNSVSVGDEIIKNRAKDETIVFHRHVTNKTEVVLGIASVFNFDGQQYVRKVYETVQPGHALFKKGLLDKIQNYRIKRVETVEKSMWTKPTKKMSGDKRIHYYYELAKGNAHDELISPWRWGTQVDFILDSMPKEVSLSHLKRNLGI